MPHKLIKGILFSELQDLIILLLDFFSNETKLVISFYGPDGQQFWCKDDKYFSPFCRYLKRIPHLWKLCKDDHMKRSDLHSFGVDIKANVNMCHFGLWNIAHPLCTDDTFYGALLTGQKKLSSEPYLQESTSIFEKKIEFLKSSNLITTEQVRILRERFLKTEMINEFPEELLAKLAAIESKLISIIDSLIKKIRKITLLRHEIHQPNIAISGTLTRLIDSLEKMKIEMVEMGYKTRSLSEIIDVCDYVRNNATLFSAIIENIVTSLSKNELVMKRQKCNILKIIQDTRRMFEILARGKKVIISPLENKALDRIYVYADRGLITRAFINLYHNAVKYSYFGEEIAFPKTVITKCSNIDRYFRVIISNYGVGILREEIEKIWEEEYRGILSSDRFRIGSGLGLFQVKEISTAHDGRVFVDSDPVSDDIITGPYLTTFTLDLPYFYEEGENKN